MHPAAHDAAMRTLLHVAHAHIGHDEDGHAGGQRGGLTSLGLRLVAMAAILAGGVLGAMAPILWARLYPAPDSVPMRLVRTLSGGTILALALIHIIPEGLEQLDSLDLGYPIGGIPVVFGLLVIVFFDYAACAFILHRRSQRDALGAAKPAAPPPPPPCCPEQGDAEQALPPAAAVSAKMASSMTGVTPMAHSHHHLPQCVITGVRQYVACYTMELGCMFHSVIIGVAIGVISEAPRVLATLAAVMVFHQLLEGVALGAVLAATAMSTAKKSFMAVVYALCMPVGIAIGIAVADAYEPESRSSLLTQGVLNTLSGGMLLAVSLFSLIAEEFSKADLLTRPRLAAGLMASVLLGVGAMAVIGIWG
ncbi:MAG: Zinc/iron permease [Monoraphidium minutum]|nr:MAG: Zinc/iron permease [Monoraphidium minutum]